MKFVFIIFGFCIAESFGDGFWDYSAYKMGRDTKVKLFYAFGRFKTRKCLEVTSDYNQINQRRVGGRCQQPP